MSPTDAQILAATCAIPIPADQAAQEEWDEYDLAVGRAALSLVAGAQGGSPEPEAVAGPVKREPLPEIVSTIIERAQRLVDHADFQLGGVLSAESRASEIPSNAASKVKARHLASLRDALRAYGISEQDKGDDHA